MKKVLFHTGRGGRFNNAGHVTCKGLVESFNPEYYGINIYFNEEEENPNILLENSEVVCTLNELKADSGSFNIDNDYNSYHWLPVADLDENDILIMIRDLSTYEYKDELIESGVDANVFKILEEFDKLNEYVYYLSNQTSWTDFKKNNEVLEFNSEDEADEAGFNKVIEIEDKYYTFN